MALKHLVPVRFRGTGRMILTDLVRARKRRKAAAIARQPGIRLHLGSGGERKAGWVNVDLLGDPIDVAWNLASPLPFEPASVDAVFHEHLLEHLPLQAGAAFMRECATGYLSPVASSGWACRMRAHPGHGRVPGGQLADDACPPALSCTEAAVTSTASSSPRVPQLSKS